MRKRLLEAVARVATGRPRAVLAVAIALAAAAAATLPGLRASTSRTELTSREDPSQRRFLEFIDEFGTPEVLIAVVEGGSADAQRRAIDRLADALARDRRVRGVFARVDVEWFRRRALWLVPPDDLERVVAALEDPRVARILGAGGLAAQIRAVEERIRAGLEGGAARGSPAEEAAGLARLESVLQALATRAGGGRSPAVDPVERLLAAPGLDDRGYFVSRDGGLRFAFVRPVDPSDDDAVVRPFVGGVRAAARAVEGEGVRIGLTGIPASLADEMGVLAHDLVLTSALSLAGVVLLLVFGFRSGRQVLLGLAPIGLGVLATFAFIRLRYGSLNLISSVFVATLLGLGIDFAVHLLARHNQARAGGLPAREAAAEAVRVAGPGITTSVVATATAFFATAVGDFEAFAQLGVIMGFGLLVCAAGAITVLPALLALGAFGGATPRAGGDLGGARVARVVGRRAAVVIVAAAVVTVPLATLAPRVGFSYDLWRLLPRGAESVEYGVKMMHRSDFNAEVATVVVPSLAEAADVARRLRALATVARVESPSDLVPADPARTRRALDRLRPLVGGLRVADPPPLDATAVSKALVALQDTLEEAGFAAKQAGREESAALARVVGAAREAGAAVALAGPEARARLAPFEAGLRRMTTLALDLARSSAEAAPFGLADLPGDLRERFVSPRGRFAVYAFPAGSPGDRAFLERYVADLRSVSAHASGYSINFYEVSGQIRRGFRQAAWLGLALIAVMVLADFRRLRGAAFALLPLAMGLVWMLGLMAALGVEYNLANLVGVPLMVGIGVAGGVQLLHRLRQEGEGVAAVERALAGTWVALLLSATTTLVGFGSLALARHRGVASLGAVLLMGVGACLVTSTVVLPAALAFARRRNP